MANPRYSVRYSTSPKFDYAVLDGETKRYVFHSNSKSECIGHAQERNGFSIDGDEQSYAKQVKAFQEGKVKEGG